METKVTPKDKASGLGGATAIVITIILKQFRVDMGAEFTAALAVLIMFAIQYFVSAK